MKILKISLTLFILTLFVSLAGVSARSYWFFGSTKISGHGKKYYSDKVVKDRESEQYFYNRRAYENATGIERNIRVQIVNRDTSATSSTKELETNTRKKFTDAGIKIDGEYQAVIWTANILSGDIIFNVCSCQ